MRPHCAFFFSSFCCSLFFLCLIVRVVQCGIVLSRRYERNFVSLWFSDCSEEARCKVAIQFKSVIDLPDDVSLKYMPHQSQEEKVQSLDLAACQSQEKKDTAASEPDTSSMYGFSAPCCSFLGDGSSTFAVDFCPG